MLFPLFGKSLQGVFHAQHWARAGETQMHEPVPLLLTNTEQSGRPWTSLDIGTLHTVCSPPAVKRPSTATPHFTTYLFSAQGVPCLSLCQSQESHFSIFVLCQQLVSIHSTKNSQ